MKCRLSKCNAQCCYNLFFDQNELERFVSRIVNPVLYFVLLFGRNVAFTAEKMENNIITPEEYIEKLKEVQRTLDMVKEDLDRAIDRMQRRIESDYEHLEQESRLAALAGREYVKLADSTLLEVGTAKIEY